MLSVDNQQGIRNPDGTLLSVGQPLANIASQNQADPSALPLFGQFTDPRLQMPYTRQASLGWSHQLSPSTVFTADFVRADGRDLNVAAAHQHARHPERRPPSGVPEPAAERHRHAAGDQRGESKYTALITGVKRRMTNNIDFSATYTLAEAKQHRSARRPTS